MEEFEYSNFKEDFIEIQDDEPEEESFSRKRYKKKKKHIPIGRILGVIVVLFFLVYFSMLIYTSNFTMIETEQAGWFEVNDYVEADAYAVRSEEYIQNTKKGIIAYVADDGEKINAGGSVAKLFSTENDVENWQEYNRINNELTLLKQMTNAESNLFVDLDTVDAQIRNNKKKKKNSVQSGRLSSARDSKLDLQQLFNERVVITGGSSNFAERIDELETELKSIDVSKSIGNVKSKNSGIFISELDGFEKSLDFEKAEKLTASEVENMLKKDPPGDAVGKIVTTLNWYLLCPLTSEQALNITAGDEIVDISIPKVISGTIPGTILAVNQDSKIKDGLMVIKCDYMDSRLAKIRKEDITIKTKSYSGIRVSRKAVHEDFISVQDYDEEGNPIGEPHDEKVQGVYVMFGRRLTFKQINIIYSEKDFVICDTDTDNPELLNGETVELYDEVVVQGKELYNGKLIK